MSKYRFGAKVFGAVLLGSASLALAQSTDQVAVNIAGDLPLEIALQSFAEQAGLQVVFFSDVTEGLESSELTGDYAVAAALDKLLGQSGLTYVFLDDTTVSVQPQVQEDKPGKATPAPETTLLAQAPATSEAAQTPEADGGGTDKRRRKVVEEVLVTARKREESLQDVPISIAAFSAADVEARSISSLRELGQFVPNFTWSGNNLGGSHSSVVFIRGVGQVDPAGFSDPGVGVYIDGVYMARMQGVDLDLMDTERVEVLRGPQGTLFGKNTIGGAINVVTARPDDEFSGKVEIVTGRYSRMDGKASVNVPLVADKLAFKFAVASRNRDGFGEILDFATKEKISEMGDVDRQSGRALLNWTPNEKVDVLLSIDGSKIREGGDVRKIREFDETPGLIRLLNSMVDPDYGNIFMTEGEFDTYSTGGNHVDVDASGVSLTVDWSLDNLTVTSVTSYREMETEFWADKDGSPYDLATVKDAVEQDQFSQEFRLNGVALDERLNWIVGVYHFEEDSWDFDKVDVFVPIRTAGPDISYYSNRWSKVDSNAVFGHATYELSDRLSLTGGLRYSDEEKDVARDKYQTFTGSLLTPYESRSASWSAVSGRLGIEYQWSDDVMAYASAARGFKSGGLNARSRGSADFQPFDPEYLWTYEIGLKSDLLDQQLRFNGALFYSDYTDIQTSMGAVNPATGDIITIWGNVAKARVQGFELDVVATPAAIPGLTLAASLGHTDAEYTKADNPRMPITVDSEFVTTPEWTSSFSAEYSVELERGELAGRVDYAYQSEVFHEVHNPPNTAQDGYGLLNARLTYTSEAGDWSVSLFGTNLTDERYITTGRDRIGSLGWLEVNYGRPREWGMSLSYAF